MLARTKLQLSAEQVELVGAASSRVELGRSEMAAEYVMEGSSIRRKKSLPRS
jgi:hypothetical protein